MLVYTLTANIDTDLSEEWLQWMQAEVILFLKETQTVADYKTFKVLNDNEGVTFTFQFFFKDETIYDFFIAEHHPKFAALLNTYGHPKVAYFNTLLEQLDI